MFSNLLNLSLSRDNKDIRFDSVFNLSMLTLKGLSILKVQLVMVKIDQHVLYGCVCKA